MPCGSSIVCCPRERREGKKKDKKESIKESAGRDVIGTPSKSVCFVSQFEA